MKLSYLIIFFLISFNSISQTFNEAYEETIKNNKVFFEWNRNSYSVVENGQKFNSVFIYGNDNQPTVVSHPKLLDSIHRWIFKNEDEKYYSNWETKHNFYSVNEENITDLYLYTLGEDAFSDFLESKFKKIIKEDNKEVIEVFEYWDDWNPRDFSGSIIVKWKNFINDVPKELILLKRVNHNYFNAYDDKNQIINLKGDISETSFFSDHGLIDIENHKFEWSEYDSRKVPIYLNSNFDLLNNKYEIKHYAFEPDKHDYFEYCGNNFYKEYLIYTEDMPYMDIDNYFLFIDRLNKDCVFR